METGFRKNARTFDSLRVQMAGKIARYFSEPTHLSYPARRTNYCSIQGHLFEPYSLFQKAGNFSWLSVASKLFLAKDACVVGHDLEAPSS